MLLFELSHYHSQLVKFNLKPVCFFSCHSNVRPVPSFPLLLTDVQTRHNTVRHHSRKQTKKKNKSCSFSKKKNFLTKSAHFCLRYICQHLRRGRQENQWSLSQISCGQGVKTLWPVHLSATQTCPGCLPWEEVTVARASTHLHIKVPDKHVQTR